MSVMVALSGTTQQMRSCKMTQYTYEIVDLGLGQEVILRSDGAWIPKDPANSDYQRYLNPEAEQSTPSVIDEA
jgi:hypothetical protein